MSPWLTCALIILATHRLTRLVVDDRVFSRPRDAVQLWAERRWVAKHPDHDPEAGCGQGGDEWCSGLSYLTGCPWCTSIYIGGAITAIVDVWFAAVPLPVLVAIAASGVTGLLATYEHSRSD